MRHSNFLKVAALAACLQAASPAHAQCETPTSAKAAVQASQERMRALDKEITDSIMTAIGYMRRRTDELDWDRERSDAFHKRLLAGEVNANLRKQLALMEPDIIGIARTMRDAQSDADYLAACPMTQQYDRHIATVKTLYEDLVEYIRSEVDALK